MKALNILIASTAFLMANIALAKGLPNKGVTKQNVIANYGKPIKKHARIGKPPITRWVYSDFEVVFEYNHVVHAYQRLSEIDNLPPSEWAPRNTLKTRK